jgi:phage/plasmid-associated DNA primase
VWKYREKGWLGTIPLPPREKHPPPLKTTGRGAAYPTNDQIAEWLEGDIDWASKPEFRDADPKKANIGLHLGPVDIPSGTVGDLTGKFEIIGLDVDDYTDGTGDTAKVKTGATQLAVLEAELGPLPATWRSSSRAGLSGIRFFLVPAGLAFRGKAAEHIDVIQAVHRFAVVFPSYHPNGGQYVWYRPTESEPEGVRVEGLADLPEAASLPLLPEGWIDFLTRGRTRDEGVPMDMDTSSTQMETWAKRKFVKSDPEREGGMCARNRSAVELWKKRINEDPSSHDKVTDAHWNILNNGAEGHAGWNLAATQIENYIVKDVKGRQKRSLNEINNEFFRSRVNALRKIKGSVDAAAQGTENAPGVKAISSGCSCYEEPAAVTAAIGANSEGAGKSEPIGQREAPKMQRRRVSRPQKSPLASAATDSNASGDSAALHTAGLVSDSEDSPDGIGVQGDFGPPVPTARKAPSEYDMTDDGNGQHFADLHLTDQGHSIRFVHDAGRTGAWIVWDYETSTWLRDVDGGKIRRQWWLVKERQKAYVAQLSKALETQIADATSTGAALTGSNAPTALINIRKKFQDWLSFSNASGMNRQANEAIKNATGWPGISVTAKELDANKALLGVANGVLELGETGIRLRPGRMGDLVTMSTGVPWIEDVDSRDARGVSLWNEFLDTFLPDPEVRRIAQIALGSAILGGNVERIMLIFIGESSTGKSTFSRIVSSALGDYGAPIGKEAFQGYKFKPALTLNAKRRFVSNSEFDSNIQMSTAVIKEMTGGGDLVPTESKGVDEVKVNDLHFTPGIATNKMPQLIDPDTAIETRLYPIAFDQALPEGSRKGDFVDLLERHALDSVLAWLIDGYVMYRANGGLVRNALTQAWRQETMSAIDDISLFISERLVVHPDHRDGSIRWQDTPKWCVSPTELYRCYMDWCTMNNHDSRKTLNSHELPRRMKDLGYVREQRRVAGVSDRWWLGIKIKSAPGLRMKRSGQSSRKAGTDGGLKSVE